MLYKITNKINGKFYIGSAIDFIKRKKEHIYWLKKNNHHNKYLQNSWNKYGEANFKFELIDEIQSSKKELLLLEQAWLNIYIPYDKNIIYNINKTTSSPFLGKNHKESSKQLLREKRFGDKNPFYGKKHTKEVLEKMSVSHVNKQVGENNPMAKLNRKLLQEIKEKRLSEKLSYQKLGIMYGFSTMTIYRALNGQSWKEIPYDE